MATKKDKQKSYGGIGRLTTDYWRERPSDPQKVRQERASKKVHDAQDRGWANKEAMRRSLPGGATSLADSARWAEFYRHQMAAASATDNKALLKRGSKQFADYLARVEGPYLAEEQVFGARDTFRALRDAITPGGYNRQAKQAQENIARYRQLAALGGQVGSQALLDSAKTGYGAAAQQYLEAASRAGQAMRQQNEARLEQLLQSNKGAYYGETLSREQIEGQIRLLEERAGKEQQRYLGTRDALNASNVGLFPDQKSPELIDAKGHYDAASSAYQQTQEELEQYRAALRYRETLDRDAEMREIAGNVTGAANFRELADVGRAMVEGRNKRAKDKARNNAYEVDDPDDNQQVARAMQAEKAALEKAGYVADLDSSYIPDDVKDVYYALFAQNPQKAREWAQYWQRVGEDQYWRDVYERSGEDAGSRLSAFIQGTFANTAAGLNPFSDGGQYASKLGSAMIGGGAEGIKQKGLFNTGFGAGTLETSLFGELSLGSAFELGSSMLQSGANAALAKMTGGLAGFTGGLGTVLLGSSAAASDYREKLEQGWDEGSAKVHALAAGISEAAFEYVSLDKLVNEDLARGFVRNFLTQGGVEASEEACTTIANRLSDGLISALSGNDSELQRRRKELISQGYETGAAEKQAEQEWMTELLSDALGGFVSGGVMTSGQYALNPLYKAVGAVEDFRDFTGALSSTGEESVSDAKDLTRGRMGRQAAEIGAQLSSEQVEAARRILGEDTAQTSGSTSSASQSEAPSPQGEGFGGQVARAAEKGSKREQRKQSTRNGAAYERAVQTIEQKIGQRGVGSVNDVYAETVEQYGEGAKSIAQDAIARAVRRQLSEAQSTADIDRMTQDQELTPEVRQAVQQAKDANYYRLLQKNGDLEAADRWLQSHSNSGKKRGALNLSAEIAGEDGSAKQVTITGIGKDAKTVKLSDGQSVPIDKLSSVDVDTKDVLQRISTFELGPAADLLWQSLQTEGGSITDGYRYVMDWATAYDQGRQGAITLEQAQKRSSLDQETVAKVFALGQTMARDMSTKAKEALEERMKITRKGGTGRAGSVDTKAIQGMLLSEAQKKQLDIVKKIAEVFGIDVEVFASGTKEISVGGKARNAYQGVNGSYKDGKIRLDINAGRNYVEDLGSGLVATMGHELTHFIQEYAPEEYRAYKEFVLATIARTEGSQTLERLIREKMDRSRNGLSRSAAEDEVVADAAQTVLSDSQALRQMAEQEPKLFDRVLQWIKDFLGRIREALADSPRMSEEARIFRALEENVRKTFGELWDKGITEAVRVHDQVGSLGSEKNTAQEGVKYSSRYEGDALATDKTLYDYDFLTNLPNMVVPTAPTLSAVKENGKVSQGKAIALGMENVRREGIKLSNGEYAVKNRYTQRYVIAGQNGLGHSLDAGNVGRLRTNARLTAIAGEIIKNGVPINALKNTNAQAENTYALAALVSSGDADIVAIVTVEQHSGEMLGLDFFDVAHAINGRIKKEGSWSATRASEFSSATTTFDISIADFLEIVNNTHRSILSQDVLDHFGDERPENGHYTDQVRYSERDYTLPSDLELMEQAAEGLTEAGGEEYWKALLEQAPELAGDEAKLRQLAKDYRAQAKRLEQTQQRLEQARQELRTTQRAVNPKGIGHVVQQVAKDFEVSDPRQTKLLQRAGQRLTELYQAALDQIDSGAELGDAWQTVYNGAVEIAELLLDEGRFTQNNSGKWTNVPYAQYIGEERQSLIDAMTSAVAVDFTTNRYRGPIRETVADRLVARTKREMQKKVDAAREKAAGLQAENERLKQDQAWMRQEAEAAKSVSGDLYQQMLDLQNELKSGKTKGQQERKATQAKIDRLQKRVLAKQAEARAWKARAQRNASLLESALDSKNRDLDALRGKMERQATAAEQEKARLVQKLEAQAKREQEILAGKLRPLAMQRLLKAERERAEAKVKERKEQVFANYIERKAATDLRKRIANLKSDLQRRLSNPTDRSYVPAGLATAMVEMLDAIDTSPREGTQAAAKYKTASEALRALAQTYDEISTDQDVGYEYRSEYDEELRDQLRELARAMQGKNLREMNTEELEKVYDAVKAIRDSMRNATKLLNSEQWQNIYQAISSVVEQQRSMTPWADAKKREQNKRLRMLDNMSVMRAVEMMSGWDRNAALYQLMQAVEQGTVKAGSWIMGYNKRLQKLKTGKNEKAYRDALTKALDFGATDKTSGGVVKMTKLQAIQIYMTWQREANNDKLVHLRKGGATIRDAVAIQDGKGSKAASHTVRVTPELIANIEDSLTDWDRAYMREIRGYLTQEAKETNKVLYRLKHRVLTTEEHYVPYIVDKAYLETKLEGSDVFNLFVKTPGSTQALQKKAPQPVIIDGMDVMMAKHVKDTANYVGLALPIRDFAKVYNGRLSGEDGEVYISLKETIQKNFQDKGTGLILQALLDVQGGSSGNNWSTHIAENLNKLQGAFVRSALLINPSVTIKQAASYIAAESVLSHNALTKGNRPILSGQDASKSPSLIAQLFASPEGRTAQRIYNEIDAHTSMHYERRLGMSQTELANEAQRSSPLRRRLNTAGASMEQSRIGHAVRKAGENLNPVTWIQRMDVATTAALWVACKEQARKDLGSSDTTQNDAFWQRATELYERCLRETQPMYDGLHRTANQKQHGGIMTYLFPFRTVPIQNHGQVAASYEAMLASKNKSQAEQKAAKKFFAKTVWANTESAFIFSLMSFLAAAMKRKTKKYRDEDEELTPWSLGVGIGKDMLSTWFSVLYPVFGSELWNVGSRIADKIEGSSGFTYDAFSVGVVDMLNDLASAGDKLFADAGKLMRGENVSFGDVGSHGLALLLKGAKLAGIPADTVKTYWEGLQGNVLDLLEGRVPALNDESVERSAATNAHRWLNAWMGADEAKLDLVEAEMLRNYQDCGKYEDEAREAMVSKLSAAAKDAYKAGSITEADTIDLLEDLGVGRDKAEEKAQYWAYQLRYPEDKDTSSAQVNAYYTKGYQAAGISMETYMSYLSKVKGLIGEDLDGDGKTDSGSKRDKDAAIIDSLDLSQDQKDAIYLARGYAESGLKDTPWHK